MTVWQRVFERHGCAPQVQYTQRDFGLSGRLRTRKPGVEATQMGHEGLGFDPGAPEGHWGASWRVVPDLASARF